MNRDHLNFRDRTLDPVSLQCGFECGPLAFECRPLPFERGPLVFHPTDERPKRFHAFGVSGILAFLAEVSGVAHLPNAYQDDGDGPQAGDGLDGADGEGCEFVSGHVASPFLSGTGC